MKHLKLRTRLCAASLLLALFFLAQCVVPYESARMLPKGEIELKGSFTHVRFNAEGESEKADNGIGLTAGYGINEKINVKFRYESLNNDGSINFISFGPKVALVQDRVAAALPIGMFFDEGETEWFISPMFLFTIPNAKNTFEATLGVRGDKFFEEDSDLLIGLNLGFGLSKDLSRWAIRPDFGVVFNPGEEGAFLTFGVAANYNIAPRAKK